MSKRPALYLVGTDDKSRTAVSHLAAGGFSRGSIADRLPEKGGNRDFAHRKATKRPAAATVDVAVEGGYQGPWRNR